MPPASLQSTSVASQGTAITPSDTTVLGYRSLWVGTGGDLSVIFFDDSSNAGAGAAVTIKNVADGTLLPIAVKKVMAATTATDIVGLA